MGSRLIANEETTEIYRILNRRLSAVAADTTGQGIERLSLDKLKQ